MLHTMLKVPAHLELPVPRVRQLWNETDEDGSGAISFDEFLAFYQKMFGGEDKSSSPLETFYRRLRPNSTKPAGPQAFQQFKAPVSARTGGARASTVVARSTLAVARASTLSTRGSVRPRERESIFVARGSQARQSVFPGGN